jgi:hypothetical protein
MPVEVVAGPVVAHGGRGSACRAAICASRRSTPASSMVVTKVWRSMCGCVLRIRMRAARARFLSRRVAACRSIRAPRLLSRIGPDGRPLMARSIARSTAGGNGTSTTFVPLAADSRYPVAVLLAEVADVGSGGLEDPQFQQAEHRHQCEVARVS